MRISDWSSDVCSSDLGADHRAVSVHQPHLVAADDGQPEPVPACDCLQHQGDQLLAGLYEPGWNVGLREQRSALPQQCAVYRPASLCTRRVLRCCELFHPGLGSRSEEHTSELQSLMRNSYAVFYL